MADSLTVSVRTPSAATFKDRDYLNSMPVQNSNDKYQRKSRSIVQDYGCGSLLEGENIKFNSRTQEGESSFVAESSIGNSEHVTTKYSFR